MTYLLSHLWPWLLAIFVIGVAIALWKRKFVPTLLIHPKLSPWLIWCGLAFLVGLILAALQVLQGGAGVWLESALAAFAAYVLGAGAGTLLEKTSLIDHKLAPGEQLPPEKRLGYVDYEKLSIGLVPTALIWLVANLVAQPSIEGDLAKSVKAKLEAVGAPATRFAVEGRDVLLAKTQPNRAELASAIDKVDGVRLVEATNLIAYEPPAEVKETTAVEPVKTNGEAITMTPIKPNAAPAKIASDDTVKKVAEPAKTETPKTEPAKTEPAANTVAQKSAEDARIEAAKTAEAAKAVAQKAADAAKDAAKPVTRKPVEEATPAPAVDAAARLKTAEADLKAIPRSGPLDLEACQKAVASTLIVDKIQFWIGSAKIHLDSGRILDRVAALLQRCPSAKAQIEGHTDNTGDEEDNKALSQRRADSVMKYLVGEGVAAGRLSAVGYGAKQPIAANDTDEGRALNRRIELELK